MARTTDNAWVIGTRGSALALWQARHVAASLRERFPELEIVERIIRSEGDENQQRPLGAGDVGVFVRRIERALSAEEIDLAVHSLKDLPAEDPEGLILGAIPERHDARDALVTREGLDVAGLPAGARIGTGSPRRITQLHDLRPDLSYVSIRGNVGTRVNKVRNGDLDGVVLALAGLERLGIDGLPIVPIDTDICLPAAGQGALGLQVRAADRRLRDGIAVLEDASSRARITAERAFLRELDGGCLAPATAFAVVDGAALQLRCAVGGRPGDSLIRASLSGSPADAAELGRKLAAIALDRGAAELLRAAREPSARDR